MALIKFTSDSKVKILDKTIFSVSGSGGGEPPALTDTILYDSEGNILDTVTGDVPENWKVFGNIAGYVEIGTSATSIGSLAFYYNILTSATIPDSVTSIGSFAFAYNQLTSVTIPNSVTTIGAYAFTSNPFASLTVNMTTIDEGIFQYHQISSLTIGNSVTTIGSGAFASTGLSSLTIGNSVTTIGSYAFAENQLTSVTIPDSVTAIQESAFSNNLNLDTVNCYTTQTAFVEDAVFQNTASPLTIHVRVTDETWTEGTGLSFQFNNNVTVIKDL
jgi:hypothetical protein